MAVTLFEAAKLLGVDPLSQAVQMTIAQSSMILQYLPFVLRGTGDTMQFDEHFSKEAAEANFRGLNASFVEGLTDQDKMQFALALLGDKAIVDVFMPNRDAVMNREVNEKSFGIAAKFNLEFIKGDRAVDPNGFNGLEVIMEKQVGGSQTLITNTGGSFTAGGDALALDILDEAIDAVRNPTAIFANANLIRQFSAAGRDSAVSGFVTHERNTFGNRVTFYNDLPLLPLKGAFNRDDILPYDEPAEDDAAASTTSLYIARLGEDGLYGAQKSNVNAVDFGRVSGESFHQTTIEWAPAVGLAHPLACARVRNILNAAIKATSV